MDLRHRMIGGPLGGQDVIVRDHRKEFEICLEPEVSLADIETMPPQFTPERHVYHRRRFRFTGREHTFWIHSSLVGELQDDHPETRADFVKASPWPATSCLEIGDATPAVATGR